jgi:hypothetical protein
MATLLTALVLAACGTPDPAPGGAPAESSDPTKIGYPSVEAALSAVRARPGVTESQSDGWTVIEDKAHRETWLFSPAGHPAHPAVVKRTFVRRQGESGTMTAAMCGAGQAACDKLVAEFNANDRKGAEMQQGGQPMLPSSGSRGGSRY